MGKGLASVVVINLDRDGHRLRHMQQELDRVGLRFKRFSACDGADLPDWLRPRFFDPEGSSWGRLNNGEIGCYASHLSIMKSVLEGSLMEPVLVLEDDVSIAKEFSSCLGDLSWVPLDWELVHLSSNPKAAYCQVGPVLEGKWMPADYLRWPTNTGAYIINCKGAKAILDAFQRREHPIDHDLRELSILSFKGYGVVPAPVTAGVTEDSSIALQGRVAVPRKHVAFGARLHKGWLNLVGKQRRWGTLQYFKAILKTFSAKRQYKVGAIKYEEYLKALALDCDRYAE